MRKLGIDKWLVRLVQSMYKDSRSRVRVGDGYSEELEWVIIWALFLARYSSSLCERLYPQSSAQLLYADDLMIRAESIEELLVREKTLKTGMEKISCEHGEDKDNGVWH